MDILLSGNLHIVLAVLMVLLLFISGNLTKEAGPVSMNFTIPMYNASRLQVSFVIVMLLRSFDGVNVHD